MSTLVTLPTALRQEPQVDGYESRLREKTFHVRTVTYVEVWGLLSVALGSLQLLGGILTLAQLQPHGLISLLIAGVQLGVGWVFLRSAKSLRAVGQTRGNDRANLMAVRRKLGAAVGVQITAFVLGVTAGMLVGIAMLAGQGL
jgi:hypothetical protein